MGKIIKNALGKVLAANGGAFEVDASIDPNIQAGNIKKGVSILGVTGTYESLGFIYEIKAGTKTTLTAAEGATLAAIPRTMDYSPWCYLFAGTGITTADLSAFTTFPRLSAQGFFALSYLVSFNLDNLVSANDAALSKAFSFCTSLLSASFPSLTSLNGAQDMFDGCSALKSFSAPLLSSFGGGGAFFRNCASLEEVNIHPEALKNSGATNNPLGYATSTVFTKLRLSAEATDNVYVNWCTHLDSDSILDVLNHLSTSASGKTCAFGNLTVSSSDPNYAAISAKVAALTNWTITGLTL